MKSFKTKKFTKLKEILLKCKKIYILMPRIQMKHIVLKSNNAIEEYEFEDKE